MVIREPERPTRPLGLPQPQPPIDPTLTPLVGNESVDDNIAECAQIAIWNVIGRRGRAITLTVDQGVVTIAGKLVTGEHRDEVIAAIGHLRGVRGVVDETIVPPHAKPAARSRPSRPRKATHIEWTQSRPFVYLVRFCSPDEASMSAAIRQAVAQLDTVLAAQALPTAQSLIVVYKNHQPQTVTLEIGVPVELETVREAAGGIHTGLTPGGASLTVRADPGIAGLRAAELVLARLAEKSGHTALNHLWQAFDAASFRPWLGHPSAVLHLAIRQKPTHIAKVRA
ncbi:MAG: BON domain-containing protein [Devosia nanyangense]|uniref:BON domain-containing protein n=1 Tax=Devosia nanyangense TaxID=1228055 RepID=A0A933L4H8_9HYPH|nr:BON domain-containing protein [Devosia nanyangense]